ncbi:hypothetical protein KFK09_016846 [Dendrobium nobile]|uniref:Integrase catalytic domain-containing protein n=1 Tax=Dendrobium nobile TaxID=94219 RepID=A0A8T3B0N4_DENNO|nr:hypothetical protein KFK09_016846 [Dendrobium nobile]
MLITEEIHIQNDSMRLANTQETQTALYAQRGRGRRGRGRNPTTSTNSSKQTAKSSITCQICLKRGHTADICWHRHDANYITQRSQPDSNNALFATTEAPASEWYLDSGASAHMTNKSDQLIQGSAYQGNDQVMVGDGRTVPIAHSGLGLLPTPDRKLLLSNLLHIPAISHNLLSISKLVSTNNISITFTPNGFTLKDLQTNQHLLSGPCKNGLYPIAMPRTSNNALSAVQTTRINWHERLGHPQQRTLHQISRNNPHLKISFLHNDCISCKLCKHHKLPFDRSVTHTTKPLELLHSDVWGPSPVTTKQGFRYYLLIIDDYSRYSWIFPLLFKSDVMHTFINFIKLIENQTNHKVKTIRTDGGGEYMHHQLQQYFTSKGIQHQVSCAYTPEQNGVSERKHRHILEMARTMLQTASIPHHFWHEAVTTVVYLINRLPSHTIKCKSPIQLMFNKDLDYDHLRTFGCACFPSLPPHTSTKLQPNSVLCVFMGYSVTQKGYKCLNFETNIISVSRHVTFLENMFPFHNKLPLSNPSTQDIPPQLLIPVSKAAEDAPVSNNTAPSMSPIQALSPTTSGSPPSSSSPMPAPIKHSMTTRSQTGSLKPICRLNLLHQVEQSAQQHVPTTYSEASKHVEWRQAMAEEFAALQQQGTWTLVPPLQNASILGCKWTFRKKFNSDGSVARYKARLVAQGNRQEHGLDYDETFSPVAKLPTIRVLFTVALYHGWTVQQLDVNNAFLHGTLTETIFMWQPKGFEDNMNPGHVCHLKKAIYGL